MHRFGRANSAYKKKRTSARSTNLFSSISNTLPTLCLFVIRSGSIKINRVFLPIEPRRRERRGLLTHSHVEKKNACVQHSKMFSSQSTREEKDEVVPGIEPGLPEYASEERSESGVITATLHNQVM